MGKFSKQVLSMYFDSDCERQLFLNLGENDTNWISPYRDLITLERVRRGLQELQKLGQEYEQRIYSYIQLFQGTQFARNNVGDVIKTEMTVQKLEELHTTLTQTKEPICFLEHYFPTPDSFLREIFGENPDISYESSPVQDYTEKLIPDILIIGNSEEVEESIFELLSNGDMREVTQEERKQRLGINIIDIKVNHRDNIGKKQFIEIIFYARALAHFLSGNNLMNKFFVRIDQNGILPNISDAPLRNVNDLLENIVPIQWNESARIFTMAIEKIKSLWQSCPKQIESIDIKVQPACGRCPFLDECKTSLGMDKEDNPSDWDVRLIPYLSPSVAEQLFSRGFLKIGQVAREIQQINIGSIPEPIYSELPLLSLKANALVQGKSISPQAGQVASVAIPRFSDMSITFTVEVDPINQRVFTIGLHLTIHVFNRRFKDLFNTWWELWAKYLENPKELRQVSDKIKQNFPNTKHESIKRFSSILKEFCDDGASLKLEDDELNETQRVKYTNFVYTYAYVNDGLDNRDEAQLAKSTLSVLWKMIYLCVIIEENICIDFQVSRFTKTDRPMLAIYYWSSELLEYLQELLERNLVYILEDDNSRNALNQMIGWLTPSESEVSDPEQHKKLYDLRIYVESTQGLPFVINYTWHELYEHLTNYKSPLPYWTPHFNYMDFQVWHRYLNELDSNQKSKYKQEIRKQIIFKIETLNRLRIVFQQQGRQLISVESTPIESVKIGRRIIPDEYHRIAHAWVLYSQLNCSVQEQEILHYRTMFPEFSIGKLRAAKVSNLKIVEREKGPRGGNYFTYEFRLCGLSSNVRISEGSLVILVPEELRLNALREYKWKIKIEDMIWDQNSECYIIKSEKTSTKLLDEYKNTNWYLFHTSMDSWTRKIVKLLAQHSFGDSWLAERLIYLWNLSNDRLSDYSGEIIDLPQVYMFYPQLLPESNPDIQQPLLSQIFPPCDESQVAAIQNAMASTISAIQGPPGTGKSQTIVALLDEFIHYVNNSPLYKGKKRTLDDYLVSQQVDKPIKILITSFSYQALFVLIEKIIESKNQDKSPSNVFKKRRIFLRSQFRDRLPSNMAHDLVRTGQGSWKYNGKSVSFRTDKTLEDVLGDDFILFANAHQLYYLSERTRNNKSRIKPDFHFDLIIVDEASQLPVDYFLASLQFVQKGQCQLDPINNYEDYDAVKALKGQIDSTPNPLTKVVIVGDHNQLPPVQQISPPEKLKGILGSLFSYYVESNFHGISSRQLEINYRSHEDIVEYTRTLGLYEKLRAYKKNAKKTLEGKLEAVQDPVMHTIMNPNKVIGAIIHDHQFETAVSALEANLVVNLIVSYVRMKEIKNEEEERKFWTDEIGVVAPHNAHGRLIIRLLQDELINRSLTFLPADELMYRLKGTIFSVEKFQGSDRSFIIASIGISSIDQLRAEEEFIYDLTRFNVLTSRAKNKFILVCSRNFLDYFPKDRTTLENASKIRKFAMNLCTNSIKITVPCNQHGDEEIEYRWK